VETTLSISSVERSKVSAPPTAISEVEAKKRCRFCQTRHDLHVEAHSRSSMRRIHTLDLG